MTEILLLALVLSCCTGCAKEELSEELEQLSMEEVEKEVREEENVSQEESGTKEDSRRPLEEKKKEDIYVFVCGAVRSPGVYVLDPESRIYEAIVLAGGITEEGAPEFVNQAKELCDGEKIYVPTKEEVQQGGEAEGTHSFMDQEDTENDSKVNINTASEEELMTIPGIGETRAKSILKYREEQGGFQVIEDLMNVEGIKEGVFEKLKDSITVNAGS